ncbi:hypothetical protein CR513_35693, partial [Mucuna pruriens]
MVYFHSSISLCKSVDQSSSMANSICSADFGSKSRQINNLQKNRRTPSSSSSSNSLQIPPCDRSRSAMVDVVMFIAVVCACGFLFFPYVEFLVTKCYEVGKVVVFLVKEEVSMAPWIYVSIGLSVVCAALATWSVVACTTRRCGNPNCKGLRKAAEFDIQLETEDCVKNSASSSAAPAMAAKDGGGGVKKGLFELPRDHHRELEAELKKMAPPNGRAVLVLRARGSGTEEASKDQEVAAILIEMGRIQERRGHPFDLLEGRKERDVFVYKWSEMTTSSTTIVAVKSKQDIKIIVKISSCRIDTKPEINQSPQTLKWTRNNRTKIHTYSYKYIKMNH